MWLFKKHKKKNTAVGISDKVAGKIAGFGVAIQSRFAATMNKLFEKMNNKRLKIWLAVFCITCGGYSIYLLTNAIVSPSATQPSIKIDPVNIPKHYNNPGDEMLSTDNAVDEETFLKIQAFKSYMDSLKQAKSIQYDSILTARPYLMDTVLLLEQIYYSQKQK
jgi:hypothetical protein